MRFEPKRVTIRISVEGDDWQKSVHAQHAFTWTELQTVHAEELVIPETVEHMWESLKRAMGK